MVNKIGICILTLLLSLNNQTFGQYDWQQRLPLSPTSNQMVCLCFANEDTGWAVGEKGTILKTMDGGVNWRIIEIPYLTYLLDVCFTSPEIGYIVGQDGIILKSLDAGENWELKQTRYTNNFNRVKFRDDLVGWIIGERGLILHTTDGGVTWNQQISNAPANLSGIEFTSDDSIFVVGDLNTILLTENNGQTWQPISFTPDQLIDPGYRDVFFFDQQHGWIGGYAYYEYYNMWVGLVLETSDGGETWQQVKPSSIRITNTIESEGSGGGQGVFSSGSIQQLCYSDSVHGLFLTEQVIQDYGRGNLPLYTLDRGKKYKCKIPGSRDGSFEGKGRFAFRTEEKVIRTGYRGEFSFSSYKGKVWDYLNPECRAIKSFTIGNDGKILATREPLYRTTGGHWDRLWTMSDDYGKSWYDFVPEVYDSVGNKIEITYGPGILNFDTPFYSIDDESTLWTIYYSNYPELGSVYESTDLGKTWHWIKSGVDRKLGVQNDYPPNVIKFLSPDTLLRYEAIIEQPEPGINTPVLDIKVSFDGGKTYEHYEFPNIWNVIMPIGSYSFSLIKDNYFFNSKSGFLIGTDGNIIKTDDAGRTWRVVNSDVVEMLWDIEFINPLVGYVVGEFGRILKTVDGGETWQKTNSGTQDNIYSIVFKNDMEGLAGTENGMLRTTDGGETWEGVPMRYHQGLVRFVEFDRDGNGYAFTPSLPRNLTYFSWHTDETGHVKPVGYNFLLTMKNDDTFVEETTGSQNIPLSFSLEQNYPNPFNNSTKIIYHLSKQEKVTLKIFNLQGQLVRTLVDESQRLGKHTIAWSGKSNLGSRVASGIYIFKLQSSRLVETKKMLYLR
jgi:photosystem II stability/assembly factor-like uncharacterized protein